MRKISILVITIILLSCSSDDGDSSPFSLPSFLRGTWENPAIPNPTYTFSSNNIIEEGCCVDGNSDYRRDYRVVFDETEFEITEIIEEGYYRVDIKSINGEGFPLVNGGTGTETFRAFRKGSVDGKEAILLEYAGTAGGFMYRVD